MMLINELSLWGILNDGMFGPDFEEHLRFKQRAIVAHAIFILRIILSRKISNLANA